LIQAKKEAVTCPPLGNRCPKTIACEQELA
jgi:hypothetical protein